MSEDAKRALSDAFRQALILAGMEAGEAAARAALILKDYSVDREETAVVVYEGGKTEYLIRNFLGAKIAAGLTERSIKHYGTALRYIFRNIGKSPDAVTSEDLTVFLARCLMMTSKANAQNYRRVLSSFYAWADREQMYPGRNPMYRVDGVKMKRQQKRAFSDMEIEKLYAACRTKRETAMIALLLSTGCRLSEAIQIKFADIDDGEVTILGKGEKERTLLLSAKAQMAIAQYMKERNDGNPYLFAGLRHDMRMFSQMRARAKLPTWYQVPDLVSDTAPLDMGSFGSVIRNIGKRAGVEHTHPHRFRRTCATMALRRGMPLPLVSKMLGHESIATTQIYLDIGDGELKNAHQKYGM